LSIAEDKDDWVIAEDKDDWTQPKCLLWWCRASLVLLDDQGQGQLYISGVHLLITLLEITLDSAQHHTITLFR